MSDPKRNEALARALREEGDALPGDFAARVAAEAEARVSWRVSWSDVVLLAAFAAMVGFGIAGWRAFAVPVQFSWRDVDVPPWMVAGAVGVALVQLLTFRQRVMT
jgi:hypothetical protein